MIRRPSKLMRFVIVTAVVAVWIICIFKKDVFSKVRKNFQESADQTESIYRDRLILVNRTCRNSAKVSTHYNFFSSSKHGLSYCQSPKVGCTHWINIFRFLANATGDVLYKSPFDIPRLVTHEGSKRRMEYTTKLDKTINRNFKFMFVRNPYARLWSAFLDKFFLPDFWRSEGVIIQTYLKKRRVSCAKGISFGEFLEYIVSKPPSKLNEHWAPFRYICDPCDFHPDFIGNMETFKQDNKYILEKFGLAWIADDIVSRDHAMQEIRMLSEYNFDLLKVYKTECLNATSLSKLLWKTFQINGYIRINSILEESKNSNWNCETFTNKVLQQHKADKLSSEKAKDQKLVYMTAAYSRVPNSVLIKLRKLYKDDFEMFGYDPEFIPLNSPSLL
ncbi:carbohydrate sulfotransferase 11-like [Patella vulgata]|uniref:carbohydrate sulfotransferase 11-like n=2 Tax=Patella vulgata TaxID=6465 RepID=UPI0024A93ECC|nr:carbohydrate sulfotransferase 11-like [Patella vulgata]